MDSKYHYKLAVTLRDNILRGYNPSSLSKLQQWQQVSEQCCLAMQHWVAENPKWNENTVSKLLNKCSKIFNEAYIEIEKCF